MAAAAAGPSMLGRLARAAPFRLVPVPLIRQPLQQRQISSLVRPAWQQPSPTSSLSRRALVAPSAASLAWPSNSRMASSSTPSSSSSPSPPLTRRPATTQEQRPLPTLPSRRPVYIGLILFSLISWTAFTLYAMNIERSSSSAFRSVLATVKEDERVRSLLGEDEMGKMGVREEKKWWAGGRVWVKGTVNMMQGRIDISFRIKGPGSEYSIEEEKLRSNGSGVSQATQVGPYRAYDLFPLFPRQQTRRQSTIQLTELLNVANSRTSAS